MAVGVLHVGGLDVGGFGILDGGLIGGGFGIPILTKFMGERCGALFAARGIFLGWAVNKGH